MTRRCVTRSIGAIGYTVITLACGGPDMLVDGDIAFVDVNVLPMDREQVLEEQTVIIDDGRIAAIGSSDEIGPEDGVPVIEADGGYLIPGLTEMHAHLPGPRMSDMDVANLLFLYIANGVTTVRGMQGDPSQFGLRDQVDRGLVVDRRYTWQVSRWAEQVFTLRRRLISGFASTKLLATTWSN